MSTPSPLFTTDDRANEHATCWLVVPSRSVKGLPPIKAELISDHRVNNERYARLVRVGNRKRVALEQHVHFCPREARRRALIQIKAAEHEVYARNIRAVVATEDARAAQRRDIEALSAARKALAGMAAADPLSASMSFSAARTTIAGMAAA